MSQPLDDPITTAYLAGLMKADSLILEQREAEGGEAACSLREVVTLDNARYRLDKHFCAVRDGDAEMDQKPFRER